MLKTTLLLREELGNYGNPDTKIERLVKDKKLFPIIRGWYTDDESTEPVSLCGVLCSPSYVSFEYALSAYGLIPEAVYTITCATTGKNRTKEYLNVFGKYIYRDIPTQVFPIGVRIDRRFDIPFQIATPEKALCDTVYKRKKIRTIREMEQLLFEDLRIDEEEFRKLDLELIEKISTYYHSTNVTYMMKVLGKAKKRSDFHQTSSSISRYSLKAGMALRPS